MQQLLMSRIFALLGNVLLGKRTPGVSRTRKPQAGLQSTSSTGFWAVYERSQAGFTPT